MPKLTTKQQLLLEVIQDTVSLPTLVHRFKQLKVPLKYNKEQDYYTNPQETLMLYQSTNPRTLGDILLDQIDGTLHTITNHNQVVAIAREYHAITHAYHLIDNGTVSTQTIKSRIADYLQYQIGIYIDDNEWTREEYWHACSLSYESNWDSLQKIKIHIAFGEDNRYSLYGQVNDQMLSHTNITDLESVTDYLENYEQLLSDCYQADLEQEEEEEEEEQ